MQMSRVHFFSIDTNSIKNPNATKRPFIRIAGCTHWPVEDIGDDDAIVAFLQI